MTAWGEVNLVPRWNVTNLSYVQASPVSAESLPEDVFFKPDGTKMYVVGVFLDSVLEYDLSLAWDVSTASYLQGFSVAAQETIPTDVFFKPDGTKMYVVGVVSKSVHEYDLSSAWDVSTASHIQSFSVADQVNSPQGAFFKPDGTKMYVVGFISKSVYEYDLSTPWDLSTASYLQSGLLSAQFYYPTGIFFKPDGTMLYAVNELPPNLVIKVDQYNLSTPWDVSTVSYLQEFSTLDQEPDVKGLFFKPDGNKMYIIGWVNRSVIEYQAVPIQFQWTPVDASGGG